MLARNVTVEDIRRAEEAVNAAYRGNIRVDIGSSGGKRVPWVRFVLRANSSRGTGAKRSASGRRTVSACWHAHRYFMGRLFVLCPNARLTTALADYRGKDDFFASHPATADANVGNAFFHIPVAHLCECEGNDPLQTAMPMQDRWAAAVALRNMGNTEWDPDRMSPDAGPGMTLDELLGEADEQSERIDALLGEDN